MIDVVGTSNQVASVTTTSDGSYAVAVASGSYDIVITPPLNSGFHSATFDGFTISGTTGLDVVLTNANAVTFRGILQTSKGELLGAATVRLSTPSLFYQAQASSTGAFSLPIPPGSYTLGVSGSPTPGSPFLCPGVSSEPRSRSAATSCRT